jgi:cytochrome c556
VDRKRCSASEFKVNKPNSLSSHLKRLVVGGIAVLGATSFAAIFAAMSQDQTVPIASDAILARKTLMNAIEDNSNRIGRMISDRDMNLAEARASAGNIFAMLTAFPHLFPPNSNQWIEGADLDPVTDTTASPEIWTNFADFYQLALTAAARADEMRRAENEEDVKSLHRSLGTLCDLCHALYLKE